jgi:hypothetical protein
MLVFITNIFKMHGQQNIKFFKYVTPVAYNFVNGVNRHCKFCVTFHPQVRLCLCMMMSTAEGIVTLGCSKFYVIEYEEISIGLFGKHVVWKMKKQTRLLGLTFIVGHVAAA